MLEYMLIRGISHKHLKNSNRKTKSRDNVRKRTFPFASCFDKDLHVLMWTNGRCIWEAEKNKWYLFVVITHIAWLEKYCLICGGGGRGGQMWDYWIVVLFVLMWTFFFFVIFFNFLKKNRDRYKYRENHMIYIYNFT